VTSPFSSVTLSSSNLGSSQEQFFPSDPSLPTLLSGASSVSADPEGEFLTHPGTVGGIVSETPETVTPPSLSKQPSNEGDISTPSSVDVDGPLMVADDDEEGYNGDGDLTLAPSAEEDDSDSDEGLTMTRRKGRLAATTVRPESRKLERRDTNASVGSTDTAKKVSMAE